MPRFAVEFHRVGVGAGFDAYRASIVDTTVPGRGDIFDVGREYASTSEHLTRITKYGEDLSEKDFPGRRVVRCEEEELPQWIHLAPKACHIVELLNAAEPQ